jgi:formyltetrahydrofolate synthetase
MHKTDLEIAREAKLTPIHKIAKRAGILDSELIPFGDNKAKVSLSSRSAYAAIRPAGSYSYRR